MLDELIGVDFDDTIADTEKLKSRLFFERTGVFLEIVRKHTVLEAKASEEEYIKLRDEFYETDLCMGVEPIPGAIEYMKQLEKEGHKMMILTFRKEASAYFTKLWLAQRGIYTIPVLPTNNNPKREFAKGIRTFLEDDLDTVKDLHGHIPDLCIFNPKNNLYELPAGVTDIRSWQQFYEHVRNQ